MTVITYPAQRELGLLFFKKGGLRNERKIAQKVSQVMKGVEYLQKDGKAAFGKTRYNYLLDEKTAGEIRKSMQDVGLIIRTTSAQTLHWREQKGVKK